MRRALFKKRVVNDKLKGACQVSAKQPMAKMFFALMSACFLGPRAEAVPVTPEQASVAARNWLRRGYGLERRMGTEVDSVRTFAGTNGAALHIAVVKGGGFVVLGSDTEDAPAVRLFRVRVDSRGRHSGKRHECRFLCVQGMQGAPSREVSERIG